MRSSRKLSVLALAVLAAGLSLTACGPDDSGASGASGTTSSASAAADRNGAPAPASADLGSGAPSTSTKSDENVTEPGDAGSGSGSGSGSKAATCAWNKVGMYAGITPGSQGELGVQLSNDGSKTCTLKGFPEVELTNATGDILNTQAADLPAKLMTLKPGDLANFHLDYPAGGEGGTDFTELIVTLPGTKYSKTIGSIDGGPLNLPMDAHVTVSPVD